MQNKKRHPDYIKLKHRIAEARTSEELERLRQVVVGTNKLFYPTKWKEDGTDIMNLFLNKESELNCMFI